MRAQNCTSIFKQCIAAYHEINDPDQRLVLPELNPIEDLLYRKCWIDTVQWHLEDQVRDLSVEPEQIARLKRRIDLSNQQRNDIVEEIDEWFLASFERVQRKPTARMNSETPAWLLDRLSILGLKIWHMEEQTRREDTDEFHRARCREKLSVLREQHADLSRCFDELLEEIRAGTRYIKVYRQMKMYNDRTLNPYLAASAGNESPRV